MFAIIHVIPEM